MNVVFCSFYISAKTDDLVIQCLMQVAANVLKITLTHKDLDTSNVGIIMILLSLLIFCLFLLTESDKS